MDGAERETLPPVGPFTTRGFGEPLTMSWHSTSEIWASDDLLEATRAGVEIWRAVPETDGYYEVSNLGGVRSWLQSNRSGRHRATTPNILTPCPNGKSNYLCVTIFYPGGRRRFVPVHNLQCEA